MAVKGRQSLYWLLARFLPADHKWLRKCYYYIHTKSARINQLFGCWSDKLSENNTLKIVNIFRCFTDQSNEFIQKIGKQKTKERLNDNGTFFYFVVLLLLFYKCQPWLWFNAYVCAIAVANYISWLWVLFFWRWYIMNILREILQISRRN